MVMVCGRDEDRWGDSMCDFAGENGGGGNDGFSVDIGREQ